MSLTNSETSCEINSEKRNGESACMEKMSLRKETVEGKKATEKPVRFSLVKSVLTAESPHSSWGVFERPSTFVHLQNVIPAENWSSICSKRTLTRI